MSTVEKIAGLMIGAVIVYLVFNSDYAGGVIGTIGSNTAGILGTLQGRNTQFPGGISVTGSGPGR